MKILQAKAAGFCMGVRRATRIVLDQTRDGRKTVATYGPLIHNPQVIEMLEGRGVRILAKDLGEGRGETVVIRAHGITPEQHQELESHGYQIVDATCPHVIRIQKLIRRHIALGEEIIIIGDRDHAEVNGLLGHARGHGHVVANQADIDALPQFGSLCVVSQTTQSYDRFDALIKPILQRWPDSSVHRTICNSTHRRQQETIEIAQKADAMIVVGGKNSANSVRLADLAAEAGAPTLHVETSEEIDFDQLQGMKTIGLTAGASTPNWLIAEVAEHIDEYFRRAWSFPARFIDRFARFSLDTNLLLAFGAASMAYGASVLEVAPIRPLGIFIAALYVFAMHSINIYYEHSRERYSNPLRWRFHNNWARTLIASGAISLFFSAALAFFLGSWAGALILSTCLGGVFYRLTIVPRFLTPILPYRRLRDLPGSKDIFTGIGWAIVLSLLPLLPAVHNQPLFLSPKAYSSIFASAITFLFVFTLVFIRSVVFDLRDIQGDQIIGRETIPVVLGTHRTHLLLTTLSGVLLVTLMSATAVGVLTPLGYLMILPIIYTNAYLYLYRCGILKPHGILIELLSTGQFLLVGILAALHQYLFAP